MTLVADVEMAKAYQRNETNEVIRKALIKLASNIVNEVTKQKVETKSTYKLSNITCRTSVTLKDSYRNL